MYYAIGAKVEINGVAIFRVLEIATTYESAIEAMSVYAGMYKGVARRLATAKEFIDYSNGKEIEWGGPYACV